MNTLHVLNTTLIVLNSQEAIHALFAKKAEHYSSKPLRKMATLYVAPGDLRRAQACANPSARAGLI